MRKPLKGRLQDSAVIWKVLLLLALMLLFTLIAMGVWILCLHGSQSVNSLKVMQMLQTVGTFCLPCLVAAWLWSRTPASWLHINKGVDWKSALLVVAVMMSAIPLINLMAWLNEKIVLPDFLSSLEQLMKSQEEATRQLTEKFIRADNVEILFYNLFLMALLPAFSEELCFRGTLQQLFDEAVTPKRGTLTNKHHLAIWVSAIIFSAVHFQFYGFVPRLLMGAFFGYLLVWSGSLWLPVLAHFTNNAMSVLLYNIFYMQGKDVEQIDAWGTGDTFWLGIISAIVVSVLIWLLHRMKKPDIIVNNL